jgi:hypothetical protein
MVVHTMVDLQCTLMVFKSQLTLVKVEVVCDAFLK